MAKKVSFRISTWHLTALFSLLYMVVVILVYRQLETSTTARAKMSQVFKPRLDNDGNFKLYANECTKIFTPNRDSNFLSHFEVVKLKANMCPAVPKPLEPDLQMEKMWASVSVKYPQYVYTSSGWIQVIDVPYYDPKPLQVFIVPHSHQDPGWRDTVEGYYLSNTRKTLDNIVNNLISNPTWKFIWSEMVLLEKWFSDSRSQTDKFKRLVERGQLEIVSGGWVMTDETVTHYAAMLDQLIEGHLWLRENIGVTPNISWSVDPFGHSPTMTYLLKLAGINNMVIQRVHFGIKRHLAQRQELEFYWRQVWDSTSKTSVFCHMMPFLLYAIHYSCGPDPHVCCQFDFYREQCKSGGVSLPVVPVKDENIKKLSWSLWDQFQKKAKLYRSNVLLVPHGDDFRYSAQKEWDQQFGNMGKLMEYMNKDKDMNIKVQFGTLSEYFKALEEDRSTRKLKIPSLSGDFIPYNDRDDQYWTGFYSSRPLLKHVTRILQAKLRVADILSTMTTAQSNYQEKLDHTKIASVLQTGHRTLGLLQHHDAITGTSKRFVMRDYAQKVQAAVGDVNSLLATLNLYWTAKPTSKANESKVKEPEVLMADDWASVNTYPQLRTIKAGNVWYVKVTNPQTVSWVSPVKIRTSNPVIVKTINGTSVPSQCNPVFGPGMKPLEGFYDIIFLADVPPLSIRTYQIKEWTTANFATMTVYGRDLPPSAFMSDFKPTKSTKGVIEIENNLLQAIFSSCTGTLQTTVRKTDQHVYHTELKFMTYGTGSWSNPFRDSSGAYIFMPRGPAQDLEILYPKMVVIRGPVASTVVSHLPGVVHSATLYNVQGPLGAGVHLENIVDISTPKWNNRELVMRLQTNVYPPESDWCVDLNGYQMHRKKLRSKFFIQGNFHPMTSMVYIEDEKLSRISLITSHTHGASSQDSGWLEVILDRRLMKDDWRGLREGVRDNQATPSSFFILPERGNVSSQKRHKQSKGPFCQPSVLAHLLQNHMNNPQQVAVVLPHPASTSDPELSKQDLLSTSGLLSRFDGWSCLYDLVNLRPLRLERHDKEGERIKSEALMVLHRSAFDCRFPETHYPCDMHRILHFDSLGSPVKLKISAASETSLAGVPKGEQMRVMATELEMMEIKLLNVEFQTT